MRLASSTVRSLLVLVLVAGVAVLPACDGDDASNVVADTVNVSLDEFTVTADQTTSSNGLIRFDVSNDGTVVHEFMVVRTNLAANALPTNANGSYQENAAGTVVEGEIENIAVGSDRQITLDLEDGHYVLLCNMVGPAGGHYSLGMRMDFTVN